MVRHEAAEALGNYEPEEEVTKMLGQMRGCGKEEIRDTCVLGY